MYVLRLEASVREVRTVRGLSKADAGGGGYKLIRFYGRLWMSAKIRFDFFTVEINFSDAEPRVTDFSL